MSTERKQRQYIRTIIISIGEQGQLPVYMELVDMDTGQISLLCISCCWLGHDGLDCRIEFRFVVGGKFLCGSGKGWSLEYGHRGQPKW